MPLYEYVADYCVQSLFCSKRFVFRQRMDEPPVTACPQCEAPLSRILSSFSAGVDMCAKVAARGQIDAGSDAPPATLKNMFGGGRVWAPSSRWPTSRGVLRLLLQCCTGVLVAGSGRDQKTGFGVMAAASSFNKCSVSLQPRQASVMETPC